MEAQLVQAIRIAQDPYSDQGLKAQAIEILTFARNKAAETWPAALNLFVATDASGARANDPQTRYFALEIISTLLDIDGPEVLDNAVFTTLQQAFASYMESEYIFGNAEAGQPYLRNKFSHTLALLFVRSYPDLWPTFLTSLIAAMRLSQSSGSQGAPLNLNVCALLLRVLAEVSGEVADQTIRGARDWAEGRQGRETRLKHNIRDRDAPAVIEAMLVMMSEGLDKIDLVGGPHSPASEPYKELVTSAISTFASYVPWIDINLTITPVTIPLLYRLLNHSVIPIRIGAANTMQRIVMKGLQDPTDKIQLARVLQLGQALEALESQTRSPFGAVRDEGELEYREALGKLLGVFGAELVRLCEEKTVTAEQQAAAESLMEPLLPTSLYLLADEYDDISQSVFPFLSALFTYWKHKRSEDGFLNEARRGFLANLMGIVMQKMKWDADTDWGPGADDPEPDEDDMAAFADLRRGLRSFIEAIALLDPDLFARSCAGIVGNTLQMYMEGQHPPWQQLELALQILYMFGELNKELRGLAKGKSGFVIMPSVSKNQRKTLDYDAVPLNQLGEMLVLLFNSNVSAYPHPAVLLQWAEIVVRYSDFFKLKREYIYQVLAAFVGPFGIHNAKRSVRNRIFYLFNRFVKESFSDIPVEHIPAILGNVGSVLTIQPEMPDEFDATEPDALLKAVEAGGPFDAQLYLFETVGSLISLIKNSNEQQIALLQSFITPLSSTMRQSPQISRNDPNAVMPVLQVHHAILALGNIAKGFPDAIPVVDNEPVPVWVSQFDQGCQDILVVLGSMNDIRIIRDATRFAFSRILASTGPAVLPYIKPLVEGLSSRPDTAEMPDLLAFLGLILHKFKEDVREVFDGLFLPLYNHISDILGQPEEGTDDVVVHREIKRAYLSYITGLLTSPLSPIFISQRNVPVLEHMLVGVLALAEDISDPLTQKSAVIFLTRTVPVWGASSAATPNGANGSHPPSNGVNGSSYSVPAQPVPGFDQFITNQLIPMAFRVPLAPKFKAKDAQSLLVMHEMATLLQTIVKTRGLEAATYLENVFLPGLGLSREDVIGMVVRLQSQDIKEQKEFKKYFSDLVKTRRKVASAADT